MLVTGVSTSDSLRTEKTLPQLTPIKFFPSSVILDRNGKLLAWNTSSSTTAEIPKRVYTNTPGFAHLLGYVSYPKKDQSGIFWQDEYIGMDGIEKQYQNLLQMTSF